MASFLLHRMMRFASGKDGTAFERDVIVAPDVTSAIAAASARTETPPGLILSGATLSASTGAVLWSALVADTGAARLLPTMS